MTGGEHLMMTPAASTPSACQLLSSHSSVFTPLSLFLFVTSFNSEIGNNFSLHVMITAYHVRRVFSIVDKIVMMMETLDNIVTDWIYVTLENIDNCLS